MQSDDKIKGNDKGANPWLLANKNPSPGGATGMLACWKMLRYVSPLRGSGFPRKPITGVGTPGYCMPRLQRSGPRPPPSLLSAASGRQVNNK
jgi:hypothetical protein